MSLHFTISNTEMYAAQAASDLLSLCAVVVSVQQDCVAVASEQTWHLWALVTALCCWLPILCHDCKHYCGVATSVVVVGHAKFICGDSCMALMCVCMHAHRLDCLKAAL